MLDFVYSGLRELLTHFRNPMHPKGLLPALRELADRYHDKTGIILEFENYAPDLILTVDQEVQIYHIAQEALANVAKHSRAQHAWLTLDMQHGQYVLTVTDDGTGAAQGSADSSFGLKIMQERAERLGGELIVTSTPGEGTTVQLKLPMACSLEEDE